MLVRITRGGKFAHPNPKFYNRPHLDVVTDEVIEVDDEQGHWLIKVDVAIQVVDERLVEIRKAQEVEVPAAPEEVEVVVAKYEGEIEEKPKKKKRGRPPGKRRKD